MHNVIEIDGLTKSYGGKKVLNNLSIVVQQGDIYGFLGPNGAGKSTTMKAILRLIQTNAGEIKVFDGEDISLSNEYLRDVGALIEEPSFYPNLSGYENLEIVQKLAHLPKENITEALKIVGLNDNAKKLAKNYSLGMKQRLGIALALVKFPKLLILDEPTNGLDPDGVREIRETIKSLPAKYGMTVMISSHILSEVDKMANRIGIIQNGTLKFQGALDELKAADCLEIKVDNLEKGYELLDQGGFDVKREDDAIISSNIERGNVIDMNSLLVSEGVGVYGLNVHHESLEEVFLKLTKEA
ncbi:ABC transporter ATP-binding protein [Periweissella cryptocerci]|uniref:ABC transporter ATP-binding protein n=1 Tax=Periweissella cryptocerci TaxID=2506420 RepID=A0A4P6YU35_9LACO|nr:ABC transporter ATP-binding protein [Periweissella cryptocerci]QBO36289.1 ABC transporter ATP-binding protein [Periweissella cryptocerci]